MQLRRWFSRKYNQPPNSPLFEQESVAYWQAHLLLDYHAEAEKLAQDLGQQPPGGSSRAYATWRQQATQRLQALCATLQGQGEHVDRLLKQDQQAAERGELPGWLQARMRAQQGEGDG